MRRAYQKIPIVDTARRCGLAIDSRSLRRSEVEASCPFCGDNGAGKYHFSLNTEKDLFRCNLCGTAGNSITLYARLKHISNKEAYEALCEESKIYPMPVLVSQHTEEPLRPLMERHAVYLDMLHLLTLFPHHEENLKERGLSMERIHENLYRSMPETEQSRRLLCKLLIERGHALKGIPGFRTYYGEWTLAGPKGFLIPVRDKDGYIQGLKIRLDDTGDGKRKYRWLSSRGMPDGTRSYSYIHVCGDVTSKRAFITEGPLKGDVASFLAKDALFVAIGGINATNGLRQVLKDLGVTEVVEVLDMDQTTNPHVKRAVAEIKKIICSIPHVQYRKFCWDAAYKGVDEYLLNYMSR